MACRLIIFGTLTLAWLCTPGTVGYCQDSDRVATSSDSDSDQVPIARLDQSVAITLYKQRIQPLVADYCYPCHGDGESEGGLKLDGFADHAAMFADRRLWTKVLKKVRAGVMPPSDMPRPTQSDTDMLARWIKYGPFEIDPDDVDPGRVTAHRMNRAEYRNTIEHLLGVKFNTTDAFPPDAAGQGLDNIADLLTMSPLLLEKYLDAAESVLEGAFPSENAREVEISGSEIRGNYGVTGERVSFNGAPELTVSYRNTHPGLFRVAIALEIVGLTPEEQTVIAEAMDKASAQDDSDSEQAEKPRAPRTKCHLLASIQSGA